MRSDLSETVSPSHVRHLRHRVCIATIESELPVRRSCFPLGETLPLYEGTTGKAMLAFLPEAEILEILSWAKSDGRDVESQSKHQLDRVRDAGVLFAVDDRTASVGGMSVPVFAATGIAGAMTVSGPSDRFGLKEMAAAAPRARRACQELSAALGYAREFPGGKEERSSVAP